QNPIYYFYKKVEENANGEASIPGDQHFKCLHGTMKVLTIMKKMKYLLNGLTGNLKSTSAVMYCLYLAMKDCPSDQITVEEIDITSGKKVLDPGVALKWFNKLESANMDIWKAFNKQVNHFLSTYSGTEIPKRPWNQEKFEDLLVKWIVAMDQPFYTVDEPKFHDSMMYTHHPSPNLKIPHHDTTNVEGKISISLDAWTSSNNYTFMAIVAHYVTKAGQLGT
ncbi:hypothetical protein L208DRAFT_1249491, partial [Tricholoma matsutake]